MAEGAPSARRTVSGRRRDLALTLQTSQLRARDVSKRSEKHQDSLRRVLAVRHIHCSVLARANSLSCRGSSAFGGAIVIRAQVVSIEILLLKDARHSAYILLINRRSQSIWGGEWGGVSIRRPFRLLGAVMRGDLRKFGGGWRRRRRKREENWGDEGEGSV